MLGRLNRRSLHALADLPFKESEGVGRFLSPKALQQIISIQRDNINLLNKSVKGSPFESLSVYELIEKTHADSSNTALYSTASQIWNTDFFLQSLTPQPVQMTGRFIQAIESQYGSIGRFKEIFSSYAQTLIGSGWIWWGKAVHNGAGENSMKYSITFNGGSPVFQSAFPSVFSSVSKIKPTYSSYNPHSNSNSSSSHETTKSLFSNFSFPDFLDGTPHKKEIPVMSNQINAPSSTHLKYSPIDSRIPPGAQSLPVIGLSIWEHSYLLDYGNDRAEYFEHFWEHINWNRCDIMMMRQIIQYIAILLICSPLSPKDTPASIEHANAERIHQNGQIVPEVNITSEISRNLFNYLWDLLWMKQRFARGSEKYFQRIPSVSFQLNSEFYDVRADHISIIYPDINRKYIKLILIADLKTQVISDLCENDTSVPPLTTAEHRILLNILLEAMRLKIVQPMA